MGETINGGSILGLSACWEETIIICNSSRKSNRIFIRVGFYFTV